MAKSETKVVSTTIERTYKVTNEAAKAAKNSVKEYFKDYEKMLSALWNGLKAEEAGFKALNNVISGIAGGCNMKPEIWLITYYSKYVDGNNLPCNRRKDKETGKVYYKRATLSGQFARGILQRAALNCIESQRVGNAFKQEIVTPEE